MPVLCFYLFPDLRVSLCHQLPNFHHIQVGYLCDLFILLDFLNFVWEQYVQLLTLFILLAVLIRLSHVLLLLLFNYFPLHYT